MFWIIILIQITVAGPPIRSALLEQAQDKLYRWELTKEAHPWIDKPTLHDYIVDYDLEKLKKEKQLEAGEKQK